MARAPATIATTSQPSAGTRNPLTQAGTGSSPPTNHAPRPRRRSPLRQAHIAANAAGGAGRPARRGGPDSRDIAAQPSDDPHQVGDQVVGISRPAQGDDPRIALSMISARPTRGRSGPAGARRTGAGRDRRRRGYRPDRHARMIGYQAAAELEPRPCRRRPGPGVELRRGRRPGGRSRDAAASRRAQALGAGRAEPRRTNEFGPSASPRGATG